MHSASVGRPRSLRQSEGGIGQETGRVTRTFGDSASSNCRVRIFAGDGIAFRNFEWQVCQLQVVSTEGCTPDI
jgi:hypothetical protein